MRFTFVIFIFIGLAVHVYGTSDGGSSSSSSKSTPMEIKEVSELENPVSWKHIKEQIDILKPDFIAILSHHGFKLNLPSSYQLKLVAALVQVMEMFLYIYIVI